MSKRSTIYIDGFNLYYGAIKNTRWKWLNLERFFTLLRQDDDIHAIKYFTALTSGSHKPNQEAYLLALETLPKVDILLGKFKRRTVECRVKPCNYTGTRLFDMPEEKRTDVNIALHMLHDAVSDNCDRFILVSGDSDLVPAIQMVKNVSPEKEIIVYVPANNPIRGAAVELRTAADKHRTLPNALLRKAQFPAKVPDGKGGMIVKPATW